MNIEIRYANHPEDVKMYSTEELRRYFLLQNVFVPGEAKLTYSHIDRIIVGGIMPKSKSISVTAGREMGVEYFFERREAGIINIGGKGRISIDGKDFILNYKDGMYIGKETKEVSFAAEESKVLPKFYFNSAPAHKSYPSKLIAFEDAKKVHLGSSEASNKRVINQFLHPDVVETCQLLMGMTALETGSVWNTMPAHTHERRMEAYFYFGMDENARVVHLMGQPSETRHLIVANEQVVLSPSWSIHSGAGTGAYTFIWGMCGENITFTDMDHVAMGDLL